VTEVEQQINDVCREVGTRALDSGEARTVTISRSYDAAIEDVWDACTNAERLPRWFLPIDGDLRVGGRYRLTGNAEGTIERCEPPRSLSATWEFGGQVSWIELHLSTEPDGHTLLKLQHISVVDDARWDEFGPGAVGVGWDMTLMGLGLHLTSGLPADRGERMAWPASAEGREFTALSSERWGDASVRAGTAGAAARAAAERTTRFYTGSE
jgi:uncharacterized protein YndB with AHSA1/START domain